MLTISQQIVILQAVLDSKPIQFRSRDVWYDYDLSGDRQLSLDFASYEWRIKPAPRVLYRIYTAAGSPLASYSDEAKAKQGLAQYSKGCTLVKFVEEL